MELIESHRLMERTDMKKITNTVWGLFFLFLSIAGYELKASSNVEKPTPQDGTIGTEVEIYQHGHHDNRR
jgi:hypothetical protein